MDIKANESKKTKDEKYDFQHEIQFCIIEFYLSIFDICSFYRFCWWKWLNDEYNSFAGRRLIKEMHQSVARFIRSLSKAK